MTKIYDLRTSGNLAGIKCIVNTCKNYARFGVSAMVEGSAPVPSCGHHLTTLIKGLMILNNTAVVIQEIPGNWYNNGGEKAIIDGQIVTVRPQEQR